MKSTIKQQTIQKIVGTAVLSAIIVILQLIASGIKIGPFTITLSLIPIVLGAILFGPISGAVLGAVFGGMVSFAVVTGADPGGFLMFQQIPALTLFLCMLKSTVAGFLSGVLWKLLQNKNRILAVLCASAICPIANTGILSIGMMVFYHDLVLTWAIGEGFANVFSYIIIGVVGFNFLVELAINLLLSPALLRVIHAVKNKL